MKKVYKEIAKKFNTNKLIEFSEQLKSLIACGIDVEDSLLQLEAINEILEKRKGH